MTRRSNRDSETERGTEGNVLHWKTGNIDFADDFLDFFKFIEVHGLMIFKVLLLQGKDLIWTPVLSNAIQDLQ